MDRGWSVFLLVKSQHKAWQLQHTYGACAHLQLQLHHICIFMVTTYRQIHYMSSPLSHNVPGWKIMKRSSGLWIHDGYRGSTVWSVEEPLFWGMDSVLVEEESSDEGWITSSSEENPSSSVLLECASTLCVRRWCTTITKVINVLVPQFSILHTNQARNRTKYLHHRSRNPAWSL